MREKIVLEPYVISAPLIFLFTFKSILIHYHGFCKKNRIPSICALKLATLLTKTNQTVNQLFTKLKYGNYEHFDLVRLHLLDSNIFSLLRPMLILNK